MPNIPELDAIVNWRLIAILVSLFIFSRPEAPYNHLCKNFKEKANYIEDNKAQEETFKKPFRNCEAFERNN